MSTHPKNYITPEQYLEIERKAEYESEYCAGEMFAMAVAKFPHNLIKMNAAMHLAWQLRPLPCRVCSSDQRVLIAPTGLYTYPDIIVVCGEPKFLDGQLDTLLNPTLIAEVLSPSTEDFDRGRKFGHYRAIESLKVYLMISSESVGAELFARQSDGKWKLMAESDRLEDTIELESVACRLKLADLYEKVELI
ncbi:MAG TPA: Uma2 family endonuclease [Bryobacteraceae bacterium]|nr:Uma2 family endonuclease [Bryobacteraceae bacterium]